jgi:hypothetical protein
VPADSRSRRVRSTLRGSPIDLTDIIVIGAALLVVAAIVALGLVSHARRAAADTVTFRMPVPTATSTPSPSGPPEIDLISVGSDTTKALAAGFGHPSGSTLHTFVGGGYGSAKAQFEDLASTVDADAAVVILVTPASDDSIGTIDLVKDVSRSVAAAKKAAPNAAVLLSGPIAPAARGAELRTLRDAVHGAALATGEHWVDPISGGWVGSGQIDATGSVTADGLKAAGKALGAAAAKLLAD